MVVPEVSNLYVDLLERTLTGSIIDDPGFAPWLDPKNPIKYDERARTGGNDWPLRAVTMIGLTRLRHLGKLVRKVIVDRVQGDLIETGAWRGGACIYMRAMLAVLGDNDRRVWVADSFKGLPPPNSTIYPADAKEKFHEIEFLKVSLDDVKANFVKFNMLDDRVRFLEGWFKDTLPSAPIAKLAILRLDGDMYESTINSLDALYAKVSPGGFVIVDDYGSVPACRKAVNDFREQYKVLEPIETIDTDGVFWCVKSNRS
jgi:O-methyltransferase